MASDAVRFLADSPDRLKLLEQVDDGPGGPRDFAADLDQSRRSIQRNLAAFEERGWVEKRDGEYHLTTKGDVVAREHREYVTALDAVEANDQLYRHLPREIAPDPAWLGDAMVVLAEPDHPQAPVSHYVSVVESVDTDEIRMISPVLSRIFHDAHAQRVVEGVRTDLVLDADRVTAAREKNPGEFATVVAVPTFTLYRRPDPIDFGLTITDDRALLLAYDDGQIRACLDATDPAVVNWARDQFDRVRRRSKRIRGRDVFQS